MVTCASGYGFLIMRRSEMNTARSSGAIRIAFRIRICGSAPSAQSPYTVAVQRPSC